MAQPTSNRPATKRISHAMCTPLERLAGATTRLRFVREARRRPGDERLPERCGGLYDRAVIRAEELPIVEPLARGAALFDVCVGQARSDDGVGEALHDQQRCRDRAGRSVFLEASRECRVGTRHQGWAIERLRERRDTLRILGREEATEVHHLARRIEPVSYTHL